MKSLLDQTIIREQVLHLSQRVIKSEIQLDRDCNYIILPQFRLPENWHKIEGVINGTAPLLIDFPDGYPVVPPIGFYIDKKVASSPNGHLYSSVHHGAPGKYIDSGHWKWYCVFIPAGGWQPVDHLVFL